MSEMSIVPYTGNGSLQIIDPNPIQRSLQLVEKMNQSTAHMRLLFMGVVNIFPTINNHIIDMSNSQDKVNEKVEEGEKKASGFGAALKLAQAGMKQLVAASGTVAGMMAQAETLQEMNTRLSLFNDGTQTNAELQKKVFDVAQRTGQSYGDTVGIMNKIGVGANKLFGSNDAQLQFIESFNQALSLSGSNASQSEAAVSQLATAFSSGTMKGDGLTSLAENAPMALKALSDGLGVSQAKLMEMADQGQLTAEQIVQAFANQKGSLNSAFNEMPATFSGSMTQLQNIWGQWLLGLNQADGPFQAIIQRMQELIMWLQTPAGIDFMNQLASMAGFLINIFLGVADVVGGVARVIAENFNIVLPILGAVIAGFLIYKAVIMATNVASQIMVAIENIKAAVTRGVAAAQAVLNAVMAANPILLIVMLVVALIGAFVLLWNTNDAFAAAMMRAWNAVLNFFDQAWIFIMKGFYGLLNFFDTVKLGIALLFEAIINDGINMINDFINLLNKIPGVAIDVIPQYVGKSAEIAAENAQKQQERSAKIGEMEQKAEANRVDREAKVEKMKNDRAAAKAKEEADKKLADMNKLSPGGQQGDLWNKWEKGASPIKPAGTGGGIGLGAGIGGAGASASASAIAEGGNLNNINKIGEVGKVSETVDISSEDLKTMRELAEMKSIQNFVTLTPQVSLTTGDINSGYDFETVVQRLANTLEEEMVGAAEGVFV
ncbi:tape measure protein [Paenibacillus sp. 1001270B_150601_E10]|uniref:tape measure protein n=1 Tax=Paenibacillus sp. 1001270B_150601_E10 TaxID=2787079 RepID=UPI00189F9ABA|nr:tape measure protein [Paenibacillus sp. 1001270B_150601_E10]